MRFVMKQKLFAWGDDFIIRDDAGRDIYFVDGRMFSWGDKLSFQDPQRRELAFISQRLLAWGPTYEIHQDGVCRAIVRKQLFTFFRCRFTVDVPGPNDPEAIGNFFDHEYRFERNGRTVAQVSKRWFSWSDTYGIDIDPREDPLLYLCAAVVIDLVCHNDRNN